MEWPLATVLDVRRAANGQGHDAVDGAAVPSPRLSEWWPLLWNYRSQEDAMSSTMTDLAAIPVVDVRDGGAVRHAMIGRDRARALNRDCVTWLPAPVRTLLPVMDALTRVWMQRSRSPYVADVAAIVAALGLPGVWFLNGSYEWGCTAVARDEDGAPWLARTLDWPYPGLGRHLEIARMRGAAGEFFNVAWPGYAGVLTASAPGRFAAAINQAPLR